MYDQKLYAKKLGVEPEKLNPQFAQNNPTVDARDASEKDVSETVNYNVNNVPKDVIENGTDSEIKDIKEKVKTFDVEMIKIVTLDEYSGPKRIQE